LGTLKKTKIFPESASLDSIQLIPSITNSNNIHENNTKTSAENELLKSIVNRLDREVILLRQNVDFLIQKQLNDYESKQKCSSNFADPVQDNYWSGKKLSNGYVSTHNEHRNAFSKHQKTYNSCEKCYHCHDSSYRTSKQICDKPKLHSNTYLVSKAGMINRLHNKNIDEVEITCNKSSKPVFKDFERLQNPKNIKSSNTDLSIMRQISNHEPTQLFDRANRSENVQKFIEFDEFKHHSNSSYQKICPTSSYHQNTKYKDNRKEDEVRIRECAKYSSSQDIGNLVIRPERLHHSRSEFIDHQKPDSLRRAIVPQGLKSPIIDQDNEPNNMGLYRLGSNSRGSRNFYSNSESANESDKSEKIDSLTQIIQPFNNTTKTDDLINKHCENDHSSKFVSPVSTQKPPCTYAKLIKTAISSSTSRSMTLASIYDWISSHFPYFDPQRSDWKNAVRHNLSLYSYFIRAEPSGVRGSSRWSVDEQAFSRSLMNKNIKGSTNSISICGKNSKTNQYSNSKFAESPAKLHLDFCSNIMTNDQSIRNNVNSNMRIASSSNSISDDESEQGGTERASSNEIFSNKITSRNSSPMSNSSSCEQKTDSSKIESVESSENNTLIKKEEDQTEVENDDQGDLLLDASENSLNACRQYQ